LAWTDYREILLQGDLDMLLDRYDFDWCLCVMGDQKGAKEIILVKQPTPGKLIETAIDRLYKKLHGADKATTPQQRQRHPTERIP